MKLDQLQYFVVTAETQHIGKASRILNVSPSAISHSIRNLEEDLGGALFEKSGKHIYLTEFGKRLSRRAKHLLDQAELLKLEFRSQDLPVEGLVRLGATHGISNLIVAPWIGKIQIDHPSLIFEAFSLRSANILEMVAAGSLDIGICFSPNPHPAVVVHHSVKTPLKIAVRKGHPILELPRKQWAEEIKNLPNASPKAFSGIEICENHPALRKIGITKSASLIFDSYEVASAYLTTSDAWCLMPEIMAQRLGLESLQIDDLDAAATVSIIGPKGRPISPVLLQALKDVLV